MNTGLEFGAAWGAGEGDDVADIFHAGDELHDSFEAEAKTSVRRAAELPLF